MMLSRSLTLLCLLTLSIWSMGHKKPYKPSHNEMVQILAGNADPPPSAKHVPRRHSDKGTDYSKLSSHRNNRLAGTHASRGPVDQIESLRVSAANTIHTNTEMLPMRKKTHHQRQQQQFPKEDSEMSTILGSSYAGHDRCLLNSTSSFPFRIVVFVDRSYLKLFKNWLLYFVSVCGTDAIDSSPTTLEIVCMDLMTPKLILDMDLRCSSFSFVMNNSKSLEQHVIRAKVWTNRVVAMQQILQHNKTSILVSDLDALWLHDPFPLINQHIGSSLIIASRGLWPETVSAAWGATLCMGLMFLKSSEFTIHLLGEMKAQLMNSKSKTAEYSDKTIKKSKARRSSSLVRKSVTTDGANQNGKELLIDDQYWLNTILQAWKLQWKSVQFPLVMNGSVVVDIGKIFRLGNVHTIALLPHTNFVRHCFPFPLHGNYSDRVGNFRYLHALSKQDEVMVLHCLGISGQAIRKNLFFVDYDLWRLGTSDVHKTPVIY